MHTFIGKSSIINYNSDMSGELIISSKGEEIEILAEDVLSFVQKHETDEKIRNYENKRSKDDSNAASNVTLLIEMIADNIDLLKSQNGNFDSGLYEEICEKLDFNLKDYLDSKKHQRGRFKSE